MPQLEQKLSQFYSNPQVVTVSKLIQSLQASDFLQVNKGVVQVSCLPEQESQVHQILRELIPWRKGPFQINNEFVDSEWQCQLKWSRLAKDLALNGKKILDIGCNNGYFMFCMLENNPQSIVGIDPIARVVLQYQLIQHLCSLNQNAQKLRLLPLGFKDYFEAYPREKFDLIFSMGILYHHRDPLMHLFQMREHLKPGGQILLETIVLPESKLFKEMSLTPRSSYAGMKNVYLIPSPSALENWIEKTKMKVVKEISLTEMTVDEQRPSAYCPSDRFKSFKDAINSNKPEFTIEGYPIPRRTSLLLETKF